MQIVIQYFDACPSWKATEEDVISAVSTLGIEAEVVLVRVETGEEALRVGFRGSPTILVSGSDLFPTEHSPIGMSCRVYSVDGNSEGSPSPRQIADALRPLASK